jgi:large subunit ribosomal protein L18
MARYDREKSRKIRQKRVRRKVQGTNERPRLCVFRSSRFIYAQLISDESNQVLASYSSRTMVEGKTCATNVEAAKRVGKEIAELAKAKKVTKAVFDRNGYIYHGRVAAVADGAREAGLEL